MRLRTGADPAGVAGCGIFIFALVVQPLIGPLLGRSWLQTEVFGTAPDPTVVATLGVLVAAQRKYWGLLILPLVWCAISAATLWAMQAPDALVMSGAAALATALTCWKTPARTHRSAAG